MKPAYFFGSNGSLLGGPGAHFGHDEDVGDLPVYRDGSSVLSCWQLSWRERLAVLFGGRVWLWVMGRTHAPVSLQAESPFPRRP